MCKTNKDKILKGELRFGVWVEIKDHGSWFVFPSPPLRVFWAGYAN